MTTTLCFLVRFVQSATAAAPYILCGLLLAGVIRLHVGQSRLRRLLDGDSLSGPLRGWTFALMLPVCSFGVLPVARELLRAGVSRRTIFVFLFATPLFNPLTLAFALSIMDLPLLAFLLSGSLAVLTLASRLISTEAPLSPPAESAVSPENVSPGIRRMAAIGVVAAEHLRPAYLCEILLGLAGAGIVGGLLDAATIGGALGQEGSWAAPLASALGLMIYVTPDQAISLLDQMFAHGNSLAAAFALLACGAGLNLGTILAARSLFGARAIAGAFGVFILATLLVGSMANATIYRPAISATDDHAGHEGLGHTHAFDSFARPHGINAESAATGTALSLIRETSSPGAVGVVLALFSLTGIGVFVRRPQTRQWLRLHLTSPARSKGTNVFTKPLSGQWLTIFGGSGCVAAIYTIALIYFPKPAETFASMSMVRAEALAAVHQQNSVEARRHFAEWEQLARRLPTGSLLRGSANGDQRMSAQILRQNLSAIQASLGGDDPDRTSRLAKSCEAAFQQCKAVFDGQPLELHADDANAMPDKVTDEAERSLYLTPSGLYTEADIVANGRQTASQRFAGFRAAHDMNPAVGSLVCPVTETKANPACNWIINGAEYQFCCPPCIDEFVRMAKESPEKIKQPNEYVKK